MVSHPGSATSAPPERSSPAPDELAPYRLSSRWEIAAWLGEIADRQTTLTLQARASTSCTARLGPFDPRRATLALQVEGNDAALRTLTEADDVLVSGSLDGVRLEFHVRHLVQVRTATGGELRCAAPDELHRWQRRDSFRVRARMHAAPMASIDVPGGPALRVRVLDVSIGGCALFLPHDAAPWAPGHLLEGVEMDLDADTRFRVDLRLLHATVTNAQARGARAGCEFIGAGGAALRALQRYIDTTQKRERLLSGR